MEETTTDSLGRLISETPNYGIARRLLVIIFSLTFLSAAIVFLFLPNKLPNDVFIWWLACFTYVVLALAILIGKARPRFRIHERGFTRPRRHLTYFPSSWPEPISTDEILAYRTVASHGLISFVLKDGRIIHVWTKSLQKKEVELFKERILPQCKRISEEKFKELRKSRDRKERLRQSRASKR